VIDFNGNLVFDKAILGSDGEIPAVFRTGLLKEETVSNMEDLMDQVEKQVVSGTDDNRKTHRPREEGETSMDSKMEDTPANYNQAN